MNRKADTRYVQCVTCNQVRSIPFESVHSTSVDEAPYPTPSDSAQWTCPVLAKAEQGHWAPCQVCFIDMLPGMIGFKGWDGALGKDLIAENL